MPIDTSGMAFPKPAHKAGQVKFSAYKYRKHKREVWEKQDHRCAKEKCGAYISEPKYAEYHHTRPGGRGHGGAYRHDLEGELICERCHIVEEENKRKVKR